MRKRDVSLQAIVLRQRVDEVRLQYIYFGNTTARQLSETPEGHLHWIAKSDALNRPMSEASRFILQRHLNGGFTDDVWVGTLCDHDGQADIQWAMMQDWEAP